MRSRKSWCRHRWTSPRRKPDSSSVLTCRVSAKRIWKYELPRVPCASPVSGKSHPIKRKERPSIPNGPPHIFRVVGLPSEIDPDRVNATVSGGLLEIKLLKVGLGKKSSRLSLRPPRSDPRRSATSSFFSVESMWLVNAKLLGWQNSLRKLYLSHASLFPCSLKYSLNVFITAPMRGPSTNSIGGSFLYLSFM